MNWADSIGATALPVVAFYLIVACNFIKEVVGCQVQNVLNDDIVAKHIVAIMLLFFLVVISSPANADRRIVQNVGITLVIYGWFWLTSRTHLYVTVLVLALLMGSYLFNIAHKRQTEEKDDAAAQFSLAWQNGLAVAALAASVVGSVLYAHAKRVEFGKSFTWSKFLTGNMQCRKFTPKNASYFT